MNIHDSVYWDVDSNVGDEVYGGVNWRVDSDVYDEVRRSDNEGF